MWWPKPSLCGPDLGRHLQKIQEFADAGLDELYIQQIGGGHEEFLRAYEREVLPTSIDVRGVGRSRLLG